MSAEGALAAILPKVSDVCAAYKRIHAENVDLRAALQSARVYVDEETCGQLLHSELCERIGTLLGERW